MKKRLWNHGKRICSMLLVIVMLVNLMPAESLAGELVDNFTTESVLSEIPDSESRRSAEELREKRTEYTKQFRLDNGLYMAAVYSEPVHYREEGEWKEIDNTLQLHSKGTGQVYKNTAGVWDVQFPQQMKVQSPVSITKDGYTLSFVMQGELKQKEHVEVTGSVTDQTLTELQNHEVQEDAETFAVQEANAVTAEIQPVDTAKQKEAAAFKEMVADKLASRLFYKNIYENTSIRYDLNANTVKESIIMDAYSSTLRGYRYTLETGEMIPVLLEDGRIDLYDRNQEHVVMVMQTPFLVDAENEYNDDIRVQLTGGGGRYTLTYLLPQEWLKESSRAWPVVLDPVVTAELDTNNILDRTVAQSYTYSETAGTMECGYRSGRGLERMFLRYAEIPELEGSETVVEAYVRLYKPEPSAGSPVVEVHKVKDTWHSSTITWANQPAHNNLVEDYTVVTDSGYHTWDVTDIVRGWYSGSNTGMMFRVPAALEAVTSNSWEQFYSSDYSSYYNLSPALYISYRNNNGIEPYYTYQTMDAGHAGTAYVSDSTGQLKVVKTVAEYASTVNPFSLNLVYNSDHFAVDPSAGDGIQKKHGLDMLFGNGFTLDIIQTIEEAEPENAAGTYLVHHDGDGTDHYFAKQSDGSYKDEDGLGLTVTVSGSVHTMTDDQGNVWVFKDGILSEIKDETGNVIWIDYQKSGVGHWFYHIYQRNQGGQDIRVASVTYKNGTSYIETLKDAAGRTYNFTYESDRLTGISMNGVQLVQYEYTDNRLTGMKDLESGYQLKFTYTRGRVSAYQEISGDETGGAVEITYGNDCTTYLDYGQDRTKDTEDDLKTYYTFDYAGRTVNACSTDSEGKVLGANNATYTGTGATENTKKNNRVLCSASVGVAAQNLMENSGFEQSLTGWNVIGVGSGTDAQVTAAGEAGFRYTGQYALKGYMEAAHTDIIGAYTEVSLVAGSTYSFSGYVNTKNISTCTGQGVYLKAEAPDGSTWQSAPVNYDTGDDWARPCVTFTATGDGSYKLYVCCEGAAGSFYADDLQLETGNTPSNRNLVDNGNLQRWKEGWLVQAGAGYGYHGDNYFLELNSGPTKNCCAWQDIRVDLPGSETYVLSGWGWADAVPDNVDTVSEENHAMDRTKSFGLQAILIYSDGTQEYHYVPFCPDVNYWQYASLTIVPKQPSKTLSVIQVVCVYEKNANEAWFDDISLVREAAQTMRYDDKGNLVSVTTTGIREQTGIYADGNLIEAYTGGNGTYTYTYDDAYKHRPVSVENGVVKQEFGYDGFGNVTSTSLQGVNGGDALKTHASYSTDGNRITSVTDAAGNTVSYAYEGTLNTAFGLASAMEDARGIKTSYSYDTFGRMTRVNGTSGSAIEYAYENGNLTAIARTDTVTEKQEYGFTYDTWGKTTGVSVGERQLADYVYGGKNGLLTSMNYGNGDSVSYTYDGLGRVETEHYSDGRTLTYEYTGEGGLGKIHDSTTGNTIYYSYDSLERLTDVQSGDFRTAFEYDEHGRVSEMSYTSPMLGSGREEYIYDTDTGNKYSDGILSGMRMVTDHDIDYNYDTTQRLTDKHYHADRAGGGYWEEFFYQDGAVDGETKSLISQRKTWTDNDTQIHDFLYTYDGNGNLLTERDTMNSTSASYTYDRKNQLTGAVFGDGRRESYTYDGGGNLLTFDNGIRSHIYTYGDASWQDLLTAVDGVELTYDGIGNPLTYYL